LGRGSFDCWSGDRGALVEGDLPASVDVCPKGAAPGLACWFAVCVSSCGFVGCEDGVGGDLSCCEVAEERGWTRWLVFQVFEDGGFVEDAAGAAEFDEVVGEEGGCQLGVVPDGWVEELFFEGPEMVFDSHVLLILAITKAILLVV
jgi:hypothetical protein